MEDVPGHAYARGCNVMWETFALAAGKGISIEEAVKYSRREGEIQVWIVIRNISKINIHVQQDYPDNWQELLDIKDIVVSVKDPATGAIICEPYEKQVDLLQYGKRKTLVFNLLKKDVDSVLVTLEYLNVKESFEIEE